MRRLILSFILLLSSCSSPRPLQTLFYYVESGDSPSLVLLEHPKADSPLATLPLRIPPSCSLWSLNPSPASALMAVELECPFGPVVFLLNTTTGDFAPLFNEAYLDYHFLAWQPDGNSLYLKIGTLSNTRISRMDVPSGREQELPLPVFVYDLTVSPDGQTLLYSLSRGLGYGSETWLSNADGSHPRQILSDPLHIIATMRYSPDGKQVALIRFADSSENFPPGELLVITSSGENARVVGAADAGRAYSPVWSPSGEKIAFIGRDDAGSPIPNIYTLKDASLKQLNGTVQSGLVWSADGAQVFFTGIENDTMKVWSIDILSGQGGPLATGFAPGWMLRGK